MPNGIRLDLQEALARGPSGIPNLEPLFAPGAIPPVFDEAPEVDEGGGFVPDGGPPSGATATFPSEPIDIGNVSIGQPVPAVKASRGERLRRLLGNFLQNFGTGLQAASRAPSGAEFAAGFGGALSAGEERRQQKSREELLRANQAFRLAEAAERKRRFDVALAAGEAQREQERIDEENAAVRAERLALADIAADEAAATIGGIERKRARSFRQMLEESKFRRGIKGQKEILTFQDILGRRREARRPAKPPLGVNQALTQARLELSSFVSQDSLLPPSEQRFSGPFGITRFQNLINERAASLLGRKPTAEEKRQIVDTKKVREFITELSDAKKTLGATEKQLLNALRVARQNGELNEAEIALVALRLELISESRKTSIEELKESLRPTPVRRFLKGAERIFTPAIEAIQGKRPFIGEPEPER